MMKGEEEVMVWMGREVLVEAAAGCIHIFIIQPPRCLEAMTYYSQFIERLPSILKIIQKHYEGAAERTENKKLREELGNAAKAIEVAAAFLDEAARRIREVKKSSE